MGIFSSCDHEWRQTSPATKGVLGWKKEHPQHKCSKCGKTELCDLNEENPNYSTDADCRQHGWYRNQCSKCGQEHDGWSESF